ELAVSRAHRRKLHQSASAAAARITRITSNAGQRLPLPAPCRFAPSSADSVVTSSGPAIVGASGGDSGAEGGVVRGVRSIPSTQTKVTLSSPPAALAARPSVYAA